ncbi:MAG: glycosyltransferase family 2 protein [Candidatus Moranbacteria bacterium]|nr:glycosyltransferase family 2 protein [Candidatus Moranbacteria bacterium]
MKKLAIIIVTYNNQATISKCLNSIFSQDTDLFDKTEIFIIDNNSCDQTGSEVKKNKNDKTHFFQNKQNKGFAAAVNQGLKIAEKSSSFNYYLFLNPDTVAQKNCIKNLAQSAEKNDKTGLIAPFIKDKAGNIIFQRGKIDWLKMKAVHAKEGERLDYLTGACLLVKKETLEKIGAFDERFFLYYEDADLCLRARRGGCEIKTTPSAEVVHQESHSSNDSLKNFHLVKSGLLFFHKHYPSWAKPYFWIMFYLRLLYHSLSGKKEVQKALLSFKKSL